MIEALETRIAPAAVFTFTDVDGDLVTIKTSKGTNAELAAIITKMEVVPGTTPKEQLQKIDFSANAAVFAGTNLTITAKRTADGSDGLVNVGYVDAADSDGGTSLQLGVVKIAGDLGRIRVEAVVGTAPIVKLLDVQSLGQFSIATQAPGGSLTSSIEGDLGGLKVRGNFVDAFFQALGNIGSVSIGGSLIGGDLSNHGYLTAGGNIGPIKIGGNLEGGNGLSSGRINADGAIESVTIGGSLMGGDGSYSASIIALGALGPVKIGHDMRGQGSNSAYLSADTLTSLTLGGSMIGEESNSAEVRITNNVGTVKVGGDIRRSAVSFGSGIFSDAGMIGSVKIGGSLLRATLLSGGSVGLMGPVTVRGDVDDGRISSSDALASVTIGGSLIGRGTANQGEVRSSSDMGPVRIGGSIVGGSAAASGAIVCSGGLSSLTVNGSIIGGAAAFSGAVFVSETTGKIRIGVDLVGGGDERAGSLDLDGDTGTVEIRGTVFGGTADVTGVVTVDGMVASIKIGGDLRGGSVDGAGTLNTTGVLRADRLLSVKIGGSIVSGTSSAGGILIRSGTIQADTDIGTLSVTGDVIGNATHTVTISASGQETPAAGKDLAIKLLSVKGRVEYANILAGYSTNGVANNADAQIGSVVVGNWIASNLIAGLTTGADAFFGDNTDTKIAVSDDGSILSKIGSIVIKGQVIGTAAATDGATFGFGAEQVGSMKVGKTIIPLTPGSGNNTFVSDGAIAVGSTRTSFIGVEDGFDVHVYEV